MRLALPAFGQRDAGLFGWVLRGTMMFARPPEPGANATVYLASAPQLADVCGGYFYDSRQIEPSPVAQDDSTAQRLWQESETIQMAVATRLILHLSRSCSHIRWSPRGAE